MTMLIKIVRILNLAPKAKLDKDFEEKLFDAFNVR